MVARLTAYELRNLVAHLASAGLPDSVHELLALPTDAGTNFWFEAKDFGDPGGYLDDVRQALGLARRDVDERLRAGGPVPGAALEIWYALLIASVRSGVGRVPAQLFAALVERGLRTADDVLAELSQGGAGVRDQRVVAALLARLPEPLRRQRTRQVLSDLPRLDGYQRGRVLTDLAPHLPAELIGEALRSIRTIDVQFTRARALVALAPHVPADLREAAVETAAELTGPALRVAARTALGQPADAESLRTALLDDQHNEPLDQCEAAIILAGVLPADLLSVVLTAAVTFRSRTADVLAALAPRLPEPLLGSAMSAAAKLGRFDHPGRALAALAPRLSRALLHRALGIARKLREPADRIEAGNEIALRHPPGQRDEILLESLRLVEGKPVWSLDMRRAFIRLVELLPEPQLPRALRIAESLSPSDGEAAALVAVGVRLSGAQRQEVLRKALRDTRRIDDEELQMVPEMTSAPVLAELARLLPGEVLPFLLENRDPHENTGLALERLGAISPHLRADELRQVLRAVRELDDGSARAAAIAALAGHVPEPARSDLLHGALSDCRRIHRQWERTMALHALAPELPYEMGEEALEIAESIQYEPGARARAEVARCLPPSLHARSLRGLTRGYERWGAVARAALARTSPEPARTDLFRRALAVIGSTDWDDTEALSVRFVVTVAADLPEHMLDEVVDFVIGYGGRRPDECWAALAAVAGRFDEPRRTTLLTQAVRVAADVAREPARVRALITLGPALPGADKVIRRVADPRWRAVGLAHLGVPVPPDLLVEPADDDRDGVEAILELLPFQPPDRVRAVLSGMRAGPRWPEHATALARVVPRLDPQLFPDLLEILGDIPAADRPPLVIALMDLHRPGRRPHSSELWSHARAAFDGGGRKAVLDAMATLAPLVDAVGGPAEATETAAVVLRVGRWHP